MVECLRVVEQINEEGARLFNATTGQPVTAGTASEQFMVLAHGFSSQQEKESNQQRTRDAIREKVRDGEIGGGICFGYDNVQNPTEDARGKGRKNTRAVVNEKQATIVRRIFDYYLDGLGPTRIAKALNEDRIPPPAAGDRGTGSWSNSCISAMLRRDRYQGVYVHGKTKRTRKGGKRNAEQQPESDWVKVEMPEWRIIDEDTWNATERRLAEQSGKYSGSGSPGPRTKYALSSLGKCDHCGGSICIRASGQVRKYMCSFHNRGAIVCPVTVKQPQDEVESALVDYLQRKVLTPNIIDQAITQICSEVKEQLRAPPEDTTDIEAKLRQLRKEQGIYAEALVSAPDVDELVNCLKQRNEQIQSLEMDLASVKRTPQMFSEIMARLETAARTKLEDMRATLANDSAGLGDLAQALFPEGLKFKALEQGDRQIWKIEGTAKLGGEYNLSKTPVGSLANRDPRYPLNSLL